MPSRRIFGRDVRGKKGPNKAEKEGRDEAYKVDSGRRFRKLLSVEARRRAREGEKERRRKRERECKSKEKVKREWKKKGVPYRCPLIFLNEYQVEEEEKEEKEEKENDKDNLSIHQWS